jgi:hypothetical protein
VWGQWLGWVQVLKAFGWSLLPTSPGLAELLLVVVLDCLVVGSSWRARFAAEHRRVPRSAQMREFVGMLVSAEILRLGGWRFSHDPGEPLA